MSKHKKQHFIPRSYLKAWTDPSVPETQTPYLWVFSKDGQTVRKKAPENIFYDTDTYTITKADGERDLVLEHGLSQLESRFASIRTSKLIRNQPLEAVEHIYVCAFLAAMQSRTKASREHHRRFWGRVRAKMDVMVEWAETATPEDRRRVHTLSPDPDSQVMGYSEVRAYAEEPLQHELPGIIQAATPLLSQLDFAVFITSDKLGFITSDHPCVWFDPEGYRRHPLYRAPALMYDSIEITLPTSPEQCIFLNRQGISGYCNIDQGMVDDINRRTRFHTDEHFVVRMDEKRDIWFGPGGEPEDSWERTEQRNPGSDDDSG